MLEPTLTKKSCEESAFESDAKLLYLIEHAADLLPSQGPITAFVHHNTLHALEDLPFAQAVLKGGETFGCQPYLSEERYRSEFARGRFLRADLEAVLIDELDERADELLGFLGTRFHLRMAMLEHALPSGPVSELRWFVEETDALRRYREGVTPAARGRVVNMTRHWVMRDLWNGGHQDGGHQDPVSEAGGRMRDIINNVMDLFHKRDIETWDDATWESFTLHVLWLQCSDGVSHADEPTSHHCRSPRHRDWILEATGEDTDRLVHDVLIRFCAAFLDQGFADWPLPERDKGLYRAFLHIYQQPAGPPDRWMRGLQRELQRLHQQQVGPLDSIRESLAILGVAEDELQGFITKTLLALRGFGGMIWQTETRGDRVVRRAPSGSLAEFLAIRLILERFALSHIAKQSMGFGGPLRELRQATEQRGAKSDHTLIPRRAFLVFQLAQVLGWEPETLNALSSAAWNRIVHEMEAFNNLERRRIFHLAYERRYRLQTLDAVALHKSRVDRHVLANQTVDQISNSSNGRKASDLAGRSSIRPLFQIVCCIDEREESFRRHLEEIAPDCETLATAGFYGVAMYYQGASDAHYTPLCPVVITPRHYVREDVVYTFESSERRRRKRRRAVGTVTHGVHVGSRTFAGGWVAAVFGSLASIPLVMRILLPRATAQLRGLIGSLVRTPSATQLQLERTEPSPGPTGGHIGYSVDEMARIVERVLRDIGVTRVFSRLVIICGHGSSSLNNPHESAHDCGACAGGRGGPNARAFSQMANDPRVRQRLANNGLIIPDDTVFVGCYHNTCDDRISYYDLDRLPSTHKVEFARASEQLDQARQRSAHERCRRFESAELRLSSEAALRHVEGRAEDLSQVRPEYGHATNALCFVGRRRWSRGLFLDRRAFLQSYEPAQDDDGLTVLTRILQAVIPVCAGINLEYYFSFVDPSGYGCGTKLPHNVTSLLGVMNGAASDLQPGLPWQMVEIHEPVRLLFVIESTPAGILRIMRDNKGIDRLVRGDWVQLATLDPTTGELHVFRRGKFERYHPEARELPEVGGSIDWYRGWRGHLGFASIRMPDPNRFQAGPSASGANTFAART